jgi:hypothetical protein
MRKLDKSHWHKGIVSFAASALFAVTAVAAQVAANPAQEFPDGAQLDASGKFQSEVQACKDGNTGQDKPTCMKEARNAQADRKRGGLTNPSTDFQANARARCDALTGEDRAACNARMMGFGTVTGSVASGGVLRQVETVVVPPGQTSVRIEPQTPNPVLLVPSQDSSGRPTLAPSQPQPQQIQR